MSQCVASELPLGTYNITVEKAGFRTTTLTRIPVSVGSPTRADVKLPTGMVEEVIEVTADVPLIETTTNNTGGTLEASEVAELPVNGRDFTKLLELVPGANSDPVGSTESAGSYGLFSLNGNRGRSNNYLLDGTDMNDGYRNLPSVNQAGVWGCPSTILPVDALAEIPVTGNPEAEFGRSSGATVNIVTKSGDNTVHGSFFEYFRDGALAARNFFNTDAQPKNSFTNHQFGGSVGGPIVRDKSFWFAAYEGQRENGGLPQLGTVPTLSDISAYQTGGGVINPVIQSLLNSKPWGALPSSGGQRDLYDALQQQQRQRDRQDRSASAHFLARRSADWPLLLLARAAELPSGHALHRLERSRLQHLDADACEHRFALLHVGSQAEPDL